MKRSRTLLRISFLTFSFESLNVQPMRIWAELNMKSEPELPVLGYYYFIKSKSEWCLLPHQRAGEGRS